MPRLFDYLPAAGTRAGPLHRGRRVQVPFGSRELVGVVAEVGPPAADAPELRTAVAVLDTAPLLHGELFDSLHWLARYLHAPLPHDGIVDLDFNRAYNPPCAFTAFATCPRPPKQNDLAVAIRAGELRHH